MFTLRQRASRYALTSGLALLALVMLSAPVAAQRFKSIKPKMTVRASKGLLGAVNNAMRTPGADTKVIVQYFRTFYFPFMTKTQPESLARLGKLREDLFKRFLHANQSVQSSKDFLTNETLGVMKVIARDNYHPAVRFNAVLIIGQLDKQYADKDNPPVPLPAATEALVELLEQDDFNGVKVPPQVKVGAIEGLERHVRYGVDPQYADRITKAAMAVMSQKAQSLDITTDVNNWMKCQAAGVLILQTKDNPNGEVQAALTELIADEEIGLDDRCHVVGLLKSMDYEKAAGAGIDVTSAMLPLGNLTKAVVDQSAEKASDYIDEIIGKPGAARGGFRGGGRRQQGPELERSHFVSQIRQINRGAKSLAGGLPDAEKEKLDELLDTLDPVVKFSIDKKSIDVEVAEKIVDVESKIENIVASWQPAAAVAADEADFAQ